MVLEAYPHRDFLAVSSVSLIGSCETRFLRSALGELEETPLMLTGKEKHEELTEGLPKISRKETVKKILSGEPCGFREVSILDKKLKMIGRIDELRFLGGFIGKKREGILIDDKFPKYFYNSLPMHYKIQLAAYAAAIQNSKDFSKVCEITKAILVCRNSETKEVIKQFEVDANTLSGWVSKIPSIVGTGWKIYNQEKEPEHRRFNISEESWIPCFCKRETYKQDTGDLRKFFK